MATHCYRSISRPAINLLKSTISYSQKTYLSTNQMPSISTRLSSRSVSQLGCLQSLFPLHSAVSSALLMSRLAVDSKGSRSLALGMISGANPGV